MLPCKPLSSCLLVFGLLAFASDLSLAQQVTAAAAGPVPTLVLEDIGKGAAPLDGPWQFHLGDDTAWAAPDADDSHWERLTADKTWGAQGHYSYTGYAWYRRHISLTPAPGGTQDFALMLPAVDDAYELYWNGKLIGKNGKLPPQPVWIFAQPPQTYGLGAVRSGVLAVRVWKSPLSSEDPGTLGGFEGVPVVGSPEAIAARKAAIDFRWLRSRQFTFALDSLYALVALLSMLSWLRDRKQWLLFWMALYSTAPLIGQILTGLRIPWSYAVASGVLQPVLALQDISLWFLLLWLLDLQDDHSIARFTRTIAFVFGTVFTLDGLVGIVWGIGWDRPLQLIDAILTAIFTPLECMPIVLVTAAVLKHRKLDSSRWFMAICAFLTEMVFILRNAASQGNRFTHWTLGDRINAPLFTLNGNSITLRNLADTLLLISIVYAVFRFSIEERRRQNALEQEFKNARELQQVLVPETLPSLPGFAVTSAYRPAKQVGGDFFQIIPVEGGSTLIILGDVSGKGLKAAMAVSLIVGAARMVADFTDSPAEVLAALNRRLYGRLQDGFATCVAMRIDPGGHCTIASAGHPAPFLNTQEMNLPGALPLGVQPSVTYEETTIRFRVGDHFALYTDGLLEARNPAGELYSFARLQDLFATNPNAAQATEAAVNFGQDDDITVLTLTRLATGVESTTKLIVPSLARSKA
jgi:phosphoserine phosphatase RsbU/P